MVFSMLASMYAQYRLKKKNFEQYNYRKKDEASKKKKDEDLQTDV